MAQMQLFYFIILQLFMNIAENSLVIIFAPVGYGYY